MKLFQHHLVTVLALVVCCIPININAWSSSQTSLPRTTTSSASSSSTKLYSTVEADKTTSSSINTDSSTTNSNKSSTKKAWFPRLIADALSPSNDYNSLVKSAYLRHIFVASEEMADLIMDVYLKGGSLPSAGKDDDDDVVVDDETSNYGASNSDIFTRLASDVSLCTDTREDGGKIGWVDNPMNTNNDEERLRKTNMVVHDLISPEVIQRVFEQRVKGGDVIKFPASSKEDADTDNKDGGGGWHIVRVDDLHIQLKPSTMVTTEGSKNVINKTRKKLKGSGNIPLSPIFQKIGDEEEDATNAVVSDSSTAVINKGIENDDKQSKTIYSVPNAQYYKIETTGCQMNVADSERIMGVLEGEMGLKSLETANVGGAVDASLIATTGNKKKKKGKKKGPTPDILLLNTCTIRDHAEQKVYDALGPYTALKRAGHPLAIVVAGCVAQQEGEALLRRFPEVDLVLGPQYIPWLGELLVEVGKGSQLCMTENMIWSEMGSNAGGGIGGGGMRNSDSSREKDGDWMVPVKRGHSTRAWVNVIYGCNEHCTYCVVPNVRGVEQSRSMEAILQECVQLAASGYKEVTLLGQNIDAYGRDMMPKRTFADLLHYLNDNLPSDTITRIRYVTSHPRYFSERVIDAVANLDKVCECFHMPFQAGDDKVLKDMRRGYSYDSYMNIIRKIRDKAPDASVCGDVIVGFPGETEEQFQRTLDLMEEVKFDNLNTFAYSPRPNTEAAEWENQIDPEVQSERLQRVQALAAKHALERSQRYLGRVVDVLVEDRNPKNGAEVMGRTRQGRQVFFPGDVAELKGELVDVEIVEARTWSLVGSMVDGDSTTE